MRKHITAATVGGLLAGGLAGATLVAPTLTAAQTGPATVAAAVHATADGEHHPTGPLQRALDKLVEEGTLTAEQADAVRQAVGEEHPDGLRIRSGLEDRLQAAADVLGMDVADVAARLRAGATLAELAQEQGVNADELVDVLVADAQERIDQAVANGRIDDEKAATLAERAEDRINRFVEEGARHRPGPGRFGRGDAGSEG